MKNYLNACIKTGTCRSSFWRTKHLQGGCFILLLVILFAIFLTSCTVQEEEKICVGTFTCGPRYFSGIPVTDLLTEPKMVKEYAEFIFRNTGYGKNHPEEMLRTISLDDEAGVWRITFDDGNVSLGGGYLIYISRDNGAVLDHCPQE